MDKPTKKRKNYNEGILIILKEKYGYSIDYLRKCLRGDRTGEMPDVIKKEYNALENASERIIKEKSESLKPVL